MKRGEIGAGKEDADGADKKKMRIKQTKKR